MTCDIAILGAGPYGLAAGAHLRRVRGLEIRAFGESMDFWHSHMPEGMFLRSPWLASNISDPEKAYSIDAFRDASGPISTPIPLNRFVEYGRWFQRNTAPDLDSRRITRIESDSPGFRVILSDGEQFKSRRVVIAAGIGSFARRLPQFANLPPEMVSHASDGSDVNQFSGKRVLVVGAGQSALESAALIHEAGARVEVIVRAPNVHWLAWKARIQKLGPIAHLLYSPYDIGPAGVSRIVALPDTVKYFPRSVQNRFRTRALRPAGARWLIDRCRNIPISTGRFVASAKEEGRKVRVRLDDGSFREIDHVLLGTGYRVNISQYPFLAPELAQKIKQVDGFPILASGFESSVPGLHFLGAPSAWNFGPLMFFVCGTDYAGNRLARYMTAHGSRNGTH